ncbi:MAG: YncE family protein [Gemmatimonadales bacterium]|nr:MAG: YncE family protein [Gemmatimonadales bacterium]
MHDLICPSPTRPWARPFLRPSRRHGAVFLLLGFLLFLSGCAGVTGDARSGEALASSPPGSVAAVTSTSPDTHYWMYVGSESADKLHRLRFGPDGFVEENAVVVGRLPTEVEGPHGVAVAPDGEHVFLTTGHGVPDGHFWKFAVGPDTVVGEPVPLGEFPATTDLTPDGMYGLVVNFNLYGDMVPSTMSIVYTPGMVEVDRIELCTMPHGVRMHPDGRHAHTVCMMDDQLVEVDTRSFSVSRRFSLVSGSEGALPADPHHDPEGDHGDHHDHHQHGGHEDPSCSPTWAQASADGSSVFVACNAADRILEIDVERWELVRSLDTGRGPYNLEVTSDGRLLVVTLKQGDAVEFLDLATGESLGRTPTSTTVVHGVVISPDDRYAFVTVEGVGAEPGKVDAFDLATLERVASVEVGQQASGIAFLRMANPGS